MGTSIEVWIVLGLGVLMATGSRLSRRSNPSFGAVGERLAPRAQYRLLLAMSAAVGVLAWVFTLVPGETATELYVGPAVPGPIAPDEPVTPPQLEPRVELLQGEAAPAGYWYSVTVSGFPSSSTVRYSCSDSGSEGFFIGTLELDETGRAFNETLCYSADGPEHWVTVEGVESTRVDWIGMTPQESLLADQILDAVNAERSARELDDLSPSLGLQFASYSHARELRQAGVLTHSTDGRAELVAYGFQSVGIVEAFMRSDGHRHLLVDPNMNPVGVAVVCDADGRMWVTIQMRRIDVSLPTLSESSVTPIVADPDGGESCDPWP